MLLLKLSFVVDYILSGVWGVITILGLIVQVYMSKGKPVLPNEAPCKKRKRRPRVRNTQQRTDVSRRAIDNRDDRLPILVNSRHENRAAFGSETDEEQLPILIGSNSRDRLKNEGQKQSTKYGTNVVC